MSTSPALPSGSTLRYTQDSADVVLSKNAEVAAPFHVAKVKREAAKNWDRFYKSHRDRFFKDRHWTTREFDDLADLGLEDAIAASKSIKGKGKAVLEVGCGAGNCVYPLLDLFDNARFHACDFSAEAVGIVKAHPAYTEDRVHAFVHDLTQPDPSLLSKLGAAFDGADGQGVDVCTCLFVLSAIPPDKMAIAARAIADATKPGGVLLFRDYALHDSAQLRFHTRASASYAEPSKLQADVPLYRRADQTMSYFFEIGELERLFESEGLVGSATVITRELSNRKLGIKEVERRFVQGIWRKPS